LFGGQLFEIGIGVDEPTLVLHLSRKPAGRGAVLVHLLNAVAERHQGHEDRCALIESRQPVRVLPDAQTMLIPECGDVAEAQGLCHVARKILAVAPAV